MILKEGGNVFRNEEGPITQRIATDDIKPTVDWMNSTFGFKFTDEEMLGTTGKKRSDDGTFEKNSSGDIDLNTDARELPKEEIIAKLTAWCQKQGIPDLEIMNKGRTFTKGWVANAGDQVHFRTPIRGNPDNGFVQTDFMMTTNPALQKGAKRGGTEKFTGADRAVMLSSLARGRGLKFSPKFGVVDPNNGDKVVADEWDKIAVILLGKGATEKDTHTVEQMLAKIKNDPDYEELIAGIKGSFEKQGRMFPESARGIQHGMMLAEKNILQKGFSAVGKGIKNTYAGYKAGRAGGEWGKMRRAYRDAGGGKTTIGQVGDLFKKFGNLLTGADPSVKKKAQETGKIILYKKGMFGKIDQKEVTLDKLADHQKDGWSFVIPRKESINEGARIQHIEDLVYFEGSRGAMRALASLRSMAEGGHKDVTIKWDGSPAVIFGRNENGEFTLTDKSGFQAKGYDGRPTSAEDLQAMFINRKKSKGKEIEDKDKAFASNMASIFPTFERAVPKDFKGYFKGDLLYYNTPPVTDKNFVFKPNPGGVEYAVDVNSDLGKRIAKSKTAVVIHRMVAPDGTESALKDIGMFQGNDLLVVPPMSVETPPEVPNAELDRLAQIIKKDSADIDSLLDKNKLRTMQLTNFADILYNYVNQSVDRGTLDNLGKDFMKWLMNHQKISERKKQKVAEYVKQNMNAFTSLWEVVQGIMNVKNNIISQLDSQGSSVKATTAGQPGGEGYVLAHPGGDMKLVNRAGFTAANRAAQR